MRLLLLSNGLSSKALADSLPDLHGARAALIPNAMASTKARQASLPHLEEELRMLGVAGAEVFDLERNRPKALAGFDLLYFLGGNAFLLTRVLRERGYADSLCRAAETAVILGSSGGALALGGTIGHIDLLDKSMNRKYGLTDMHGLGLTKSSICPHRDRFREKYPNFEERMQAFQSQTGNRLYLLQDGEGLLCTETGETFIRRG